MVLEQAAETPEEFVDELKPGTKLLQGQYTIVRFINAGGFGITYLAKNSLDREVVIKECFPGSFCRRSQAAVGARSRAHEKEFAQIVKLFVQEAKSLSRLIHPNIVGVHQVFEDNDTAYMAMDYIEGRDLLDIVEHNRDGLKPKQIVTIVKKLLGAVAFIHDNGMLHRDISPDNVLINQSGDPILIDFGAARQQATVIGGKALSAMRVVKDGYSPQEFYISGSVQSSSSDLYALAATFYHAITGTTPPGSQKRLVGMAERGVDPYQPLAGRFEDYPDGFLEAIDEAINVLPKDRIQSARDWLDRIGTRPELKVVQMKNRSEYGLAEKSAPAPDAARKAAPAAKPAPRERLVTTSKRLALLLSATAIILAGISFTLPKYSADDDNGASAAADVPEPPAAPIDLTLAAAPGAPFSAAFAGIAAAAAAEAVPAIAPETATAGAVEAPVEVAVAPPPAAPEPDAPALPGPDAPEAVAEAGLGAAASAPADDVAFASNPAAPAEAAEAAAPPASDDNTVLAVVTLTPDAALVADARDATDAGVLARQIDDTRWRVTLPFKSVRTEGSGSFPQITEVDADLAPAPENGWIREGVIVYAIDGMFVSDQAAIERVLNRSAGFGENLLLAVPARIKTSRSAAFEQVTLAVPAVLRVTLANGIVLSTEVIDGTWQTRVAAIDAPVEGGLQVGDVLVSELTTGAALDSAYSVEDAMSEIALAKRPVAVFAVNRNGESIVRTMQLATEG